MVVESTLDSLVSGMSQYAQATQGGNELSRLEIC